MRLVRRRSRSRFYPPTLLLLLALVVPDRSFAAPVPTRAGTYTELAGVDDSTIAAPTPGLRGGEKHLVFDPCLPGVMYSASEGSGVWRSTDGGRSWTPKSHGLLNLMVDVIIADPNTCQLYAAQGAEYGGGGGAVYRSDDHAETWKRVAATNQPLPARQAFTDMTVADNETVFMSASNSKTSCGALFRSDDAGETWCAYLSPCDRILLPGDVELCENGINNIFGDDGLSVDAYWTGDGPSDLHEVYYGDSKVYWPWRATYRTPTFEAADLTWQLRDKWDDFPCTDLGPTADPRYDCPNPYDQWWLSELWAHPPATYVDYRNSGERLRTANVVLDPRDSDYRFARHKRWSDPWCAAGRSFCASVSPSRGIDCCNQPFLELLDLNIAYHDGTLDVTNPDPDRKGDRVWKNVIDLQDCFGDSVKEVNAIMFSPTGDPRIYANAYPFILSCDASAGGPDHCTDSDHWDCIVNLSSDIPSPNCLDCPSGVDWFGEGLFWEKMRVSRELLDGENQLFFASGDHEATVEFLRVWKEEGEWHEEQLRDPVTCDDAGFGLLTPEDIIETEHAGVPRLLFGSGRATMISDDGGLTWSNAVFGTRAGAPILASAPSDEAVAYAMNHQGIVKSSDGGQTWYFVESLFNRPGCGGCKHVLQTDANSDGIPECPSGCPGCLATCTVTTGPCTEPGAGCGRFDVMPGSVTDLIVDHSDEDLLFAASEVGVWRWKYPYDGVSYPAIEPECLSFEGATCAGAGWERLCDEDGGSAGTGEAACDAYFLSIAQDPSNPTHLYAGALDGLYRSVDGGASWTLQLPGPTVNAVCVLPDSIPFAPRFYLATSEGVFVSMNGLSFALTLDGVPAKDVHARPGSSGFPFFEVYAAVTDFQPDGPVEGLYESLDSGATWRKIVAADDNQSFVSVRAANDGTVLAGRVGDGLYRLDAAFPVACDHLAWEPLAGDPGTQRFGHAVAGLGDVPDPPSRVGEPDCIGELAVLEFTDDPAPEARIRILDDAGTDRRPPIDPGVGTVFPEGSLLGVGDVDDDGCPDVVVGLVESGGDERVLVFNTCTARLIEELSTGVDAFGASLARSDSHLFVGAPNASAPRGFVYDLTDLAAPPLELVPNPSFHQFGRAAAFGDLDGDGDDELAVGAPGAAPFSSGVVAVFEIGSPVPSTVISSPSTFAAFGHSLDSGHDVRSVGTGGPDGSDDLVVGAPGANAVFWLANQSDATPASALGDGFGDQFGRTVVLAPDVTGDDFADLVVGAPGLFGVGAVHLHDGHGPFVSRTCTVMGGSPGGAFGESLADAGPLDRNRTSDLLIGQPGAGNGTVHVRHVHH